MGDLGVVVVHRVRLRATGCGRGQSGEKLLPGENTLTAWSRREWQEEMVADTGQVDSLLLDLFLDRRGHEPTWITLEVDATEDPLNGRAGVARAEIGQEPSTPCHNVSMQRHAPSPLGPSTRTVRASCWYSPRRCFIFASGLADGRYP